MRRAGLVLSLVALSRSLLPFVAEARFDLWARTAPTLWLVFFFRCSSSLEHVFVQVAHCLAKKKTKRNEKQTVNIRLKERENKTEMGPYIIDDQREMMEEASYRHRTRTWNAGAEKQLRTEFSLLFLPSLASMMHELGDIAFSAPIEMSIDRERENAIWVATKTISPTKRRINQRKKIRNMRWRW